VESGWGRADSFGLLTKPSAMFPGPWGPDLMRLKAEERYEEAAVVRDRLRAQASVPGLCPLRAYQPPPGGGVRVRVRFRVSHDS